MQGEARIEQLAKQMRARLMRRDRRKLHQALAGFPAGACEIASYLLALWFEENGEAGFALCLQGIGSDDEHAFLIRNGLIVDITGDQFGWPPVIVTGSSNWHHGFDEVDLDQSLKRIYGPVLDRARPALLKAAAQTGAA